MLTMHAKTVFAVFVMALPVAVLFSAVLMTISLFAKTFKEAQSYLTPMTFVVIVPAIAAVLPGHRADVEARAGSHSQCEPACAKSLSPARITGTTSR